MAVPGASAAARFASFLGRLNPIPAFPTYTGPYKVGTMDVEIPVTELSSPFAVPDDAGNIPTILFRVFYPAVSESNEKGITWLPTPQRHYISAYTRFMGVFPAFAELLSYLPRHFYYASIPAHKNAVMKQAETENGRWPAMIFSHGLGGSRNSYSYVAGSLASHGVIVFCPEHRDGSAVASIARVPSPNGRVARKIFPYCRISHELTPEVHGAREAQIRIRLWELGLLHEAILAMDAGSGFTNLNTSTPSLAQFVDQLDVNEPGKIIFGGHSFGASTVYQLLKSTYYADVPEIAGMEKPLYVPTNDCKVRHQITEKTVIMLLDMWCLPLMAPNLAPLFNLPLPLYADVPSAPGGTALLAVESETFYKWSEHLDMKARLLSPDPTQKIVTAAVFERPSGRRLAEPNFFYAGDSAHLSQSDFGILFPWLTKKIFNALEPERALRLNLRAQLQLLRANNFPVSRTFIGDLVDGARIDKLNVPSDDSQDASEEGLISTLTHGLMDDEAIFHRSKEGPVSHWHWIDIIGLGDSGKNEEGKTVEEQVADGELQMAGELEPNQQEPSTAAINAATTEEKGIAMPEAPGWYEI